MKVNCLLLLLLLMFPIKLISKKVRNEGIGGPNKDNTTNLSEV